MPVGDGLVVGGVVDVAPAPWPEAPVVPGLPAPLWTSPVVPDTPPDVELPMLPVVPPVIPLAPEPLELDPVAELPPMSPLPVPVLLHAASANAVMPPMRMP